MLKNKTVAVILVILAIAAVAYGVIKFQPVKVEKELVCEKCEQVFKAQLTANAAFPVACPKCGPGTGYQIAYLNCGKCNKEYVFADKGDRKYLESKCKGCNGDLMPGKLPVIGDKK